MTGSHPKVPAFERSRIEQSIPAAFSAAVARHSTRIAISDGGYSLSYRELDERSNQVAHAILDAVGDPAVPVGILDGQGHGAIAAILGVLKAGKMYVAMEPADRVRDLRRIVGECRPPLIVTSARHTALALRVANDECDVLNIDDTASSAATHAPRVHLSPDGVAYIFYTSGSTGAPKGVYDCHRNVLHNVMRYTNNLRISSADRHSLIQSCAFSGTVSTIFCTLLAGGTLCPFDLRSRTTEEMIEWVNAERITIFHSVPTIFDRLLSTNTRFPRLRAIRLEGDQSHPRHVRRFQEHFGPDCILANGLGATETGLVRQYFIGTQPKYCDSVVPVGFALDDMQVSIVDEKGNSVPDGEIGNIVVRSPYLALGYWNNPELTAAVFSACPDESGSRSYRSGDLGRMRPDGCLEFHGRDDSLRKVRGLSVDISRIESALCSVTSIEEAVVLVREDTAGEQQLVAYLVAAEGDRPHTESIRRALAEKLAASAIPSRFVFLDELPLDRNGKVRRRLLPAPDPPDAGSCRVAPTTARQNAIADCFSEVLGIDDVGLHDSFLDLGGDSLKATELLLLFREVLGISCSPHILAVDDTVAGIDRNLDRQAPAGNVVCMQARGDRQAVFCIHGPRGHLLSYRHIARMLSPDHPVYGITYAPPLSGDSGTESLEHLARRYVESVKQIQDVGPYVLIGECFGGLAAFEMAQQLRNQSDDVAMLVLIDTRFPTGLVRQLGVRTTRAANWLRRSDISFGDKCSFVLRRCVGFLAWIRNETELRMAMARGRILREAGGASANDVDSVVETLRRIEHRYRPRPYGGEMILICPGRPHNQLGWRHVAENGLPIIEIPVDSTSGYGSHLTELPAVAELVSTLRKKLAETSA